MSLGKTELELLHRIAQANRANVSLVRSVDCRYSCDLSMPADNLKYIDPSDGATTRRVAKKGRYACSADREYSDERISGSEDRLLFVRHGSKAWVRPYMPQGSPGLVQTGTLPNKKLKPGTQSPFLQVDNGLSAKLDSLDPQQDGTVLSAQTTSVDGKPSVQVVISRPGCAAKCPCIPRDSTNEMTLWYASDSGYTLSKLSGVFSMALSIGRREEIHYSGEVTWTRLDLHGDTLYFPLTVRSRETREGKPFRTHDYAIDPASLRINPDLPDDLFTCKIRPDDQVIDLDAQP